MHTPPIIALFATVAFIFYLFRRDSREGPNVTRAFWLPLIWMLLICSRSVVQWLNLFGFPIGAQSMEEGNPLDAFVYFALIAAGIYILNKRQVSLSEVFRNNGWLMAFLVYCLISIAWSDFPFVAFKRWIKILGHPVMVLVLFTEPAPEEALIRLMKRSAYILVPLSIMFIKYYPEYGRSFDEWTGQPLNLGIMGDKNQLGWVCMILGFFYLWHLLKTLNTEKSKARRNELILTAAFIYMVWWLLSKADSATSLFSLLIGTVVMLILGRRFVNKNALGTYALLVVFALVVGEFVFGIFEYIVDLSGHDATISGRSQLWSELLAFHSNPIFGTGFESFWLGDRLRTLWATHWWHPNEAHNGYLETYLNLGLIGLFLLLGLIVAAFRKIHVEMLSNFELGRFRMGFLAAVIVYNWTESSFKGLSPIWFVFYMIAMSCPEPELTPIEESSEIPHSEEEIEVAYYRGSTRDL
jgi:exopolysaccharide production protein ExoQ